MRYFLSALLAAVLVRIIFKPILKRLGILDYLAHWETDWITGIGIAVLIFLIPLTWVMVFHGP